MSGQPHRVAVFAATRADLFPLSPVLSALAAEPDLAVTLLASGTIRNTDFGDPLADIDLTGIEVSWVEGDLGASRFADIAQGGSRISAAMAETLPALRPDACVVLGDRWELLYAVPPMLLFGVPIVHLHGGEVTEGAIDDRIRHAVTKLADLHCVSTEDAGRRVRQLGEPPERVFVTGAPSLDRVVDTTPASEETLLRLFGFAPQRPIALVTYHPPTVGEPDPGGAADAVLEAAARTTGAVLVTHPGLDTGREEVLEAVGRAARAHAHVVDVQSLGADYMPVLAAADVVVGNSSSGILEAATFGTPVVNVGDRQLGRLSGENVVDVTSEQPAIENAIRRCLEPGFRERAARALNIYGDGNAASRVVDVVRRAVAGGLRRKAFVDDRTENRR